MLVAFTLALVGLMRPLVDGISYVYPQLTVPIALLRLAELVTLMAVFCLFPISYVSSWAAGGIGDHCRADAAQLPRGSERACICSHRHKDRPVARVLFRAGRGASGGAFYVCPGCAPYRDVRHGQYYSRRAYGRALAAIHRVTDTMPFTVKRTPLDVNLLLIESIERLASTFPQRREDWAYLRASAPHLRGFMEGLGTEPPAYGICHGDASSGNAHVTADGQVTLYLFDFCGPGWRAYDLGTFLINPTDEVAGAFLAGCREVRAVDPEELATLPAFQAAQNRWMLGVRASYVNEWGLAFISDRFVDSVMSNIRQNLAKIKGALA